MIPTLVVISLLAFVISANAPGDPVDRLLSVAENTSGEATATGGDREEMKQEIIRKMGLDLPLFYIGFGTLAENREIHAITDNQKRKTLLYLARVSGRPDEIFALHTAIERLKDVLKFDQNIGDSDSLNILTDKDLSVRIESSCAGLMTKGSFNLFHSKCDTLNLLLNQLPKQWESSLIEDIKKNIHIVINEQKVWKALVPVVSWFGLQNQYHHWMFGNGSTSKGIIRGDFGISYRDGQRISDRIGQKMKWSLILAVISILIAYAVSIPVGLYAGYRANSLFDKVTGLLLFALYSLPGFFVGTLLLVLFANPDFFDWFPESGVKDPSEFDSNWGIFKRLSHYAPYLVLPVITYTYASFAFISRQMRGGIADVMKQDFIRTARAKGLSEKNVLLKHAFRNALLPIITIFASIFPVAFGGSVIIETIFSIPGMGLEIYESIQNYDYPMIVAVFTIFGFLTIIGYFISDLLYKAADPRINLGGNK